MINTRDSGTTPLAKFFNRMLPSLKPDIFFEGGTLHMMIILADATSLGITTFRNLNKYLKN